MKIKREQDEERIVVRIRKADEETWYSVGEEHVVKNKISFNWEHEEPFFEKKRRPVWNKSKRLRNTKKTQR